MVNKHLTEAKRQTPSRATTGLLVVGTVALYYESVLHTDVARGAHSSLGNLTPSEFVMKMALQKQAA
jgi:hypothetical protein